MYAPECSKRILREPLIKVMTIFPKSNRYQLYQVQSNVELQLPPPLVILHYFRILLFFWQRISLYQWILKLILIHFLYRHTHIIELFVRWIIVQIGEPATIDIRVLLVQVFWPALLFY